MQPLKTHLTTHRQKYTLAGTLVLVTALIILVANRLEYWSFSGTSEVTIVSPRDNTIVFVDGKNQAILNKGESIDLVVRSGNRSILAASEGFWPWSKDLVTVKDSSITLAPFLLPIETKSKQVAVTDESYAPISRAIFSTNLPTPDRPLQSNNVSITLDSDVIVATWTGAPDELPWDFCIHDGENTECYQSLDILRSIAPVRSVAFHPGRSDVVIFASGENIYAIEINQDPVQNFQTIYEGAAPRFRIFENQLQILDGSRLLLIDF